MSQDRTDAGSTNRINAVANAFNIVSAVQERGQCGVSELADHLDIPKSTAHVYLKTLEDLGYVINEDGTYRLSLRFLEIGGRVRHERKVYLAARSEVDDLSRTTGEVATIGYEEDGMRVLVYRSEPPEGVSDNAPTGEFTRMHWTAVGKSLLAQLSDDEVLDIVERYGLPAATDNTITDTNTLLEEMETIRSQGYSMEDEERVNGVRSIAVPIPGEDDEPGNAAISIAGPKHRFSDERIESELLPELQNTANVIELQYKHY
ncbi:IclR family transcriptional regulator [Saliphagus sp. GCM10025334]